MITIKYFKQQEFDSKDPDGSGRGTGGNMRLSTLMKLDRARELAGVPFVINSGFRTEAHNRRMGGAPRSAHLRGYAVDIRTSPATQERVINALRQAGFHRIGVYKTFVHADDDPTLPAATWR